MSWKADYELDTIDCKLQQKRIEGNKLINFLIWHYRKASAFALQSALYRCRAFIGDLKQLS